MDLVTVPGSSTTSWVFYQVDHVTSSPTPSTKQWICWGFSGHHRETDGKICERGKNCGIMVFYNTGTTPISSRSPVSIRDVDRKKATFHTFLKIPSSIGHNIDTSRDLKRNCWGGQPNTTSTGTMELEPGQPVFCQGSAQKCFGEQPLLTNQQLSQIPIGSGFQMTPSWEGPDPWSSQGLYLLILSFRAEAQQRKLWRICQLNILVILSDSWMNDQCCLLHLWQVWPHQQHLIGTAKSEK